MQRSTLNKLAIIGGSGFIEIPNLKVIESKHLQTPYGTPSAAYIIGELENTQIIFLARHGNPHCIPPHKINYRANIYGLKELGVQEIISIAAVGGISDNMHPPGMIIPDQIIDYTYARAHTFYEENLQQVKHIDFSFPYTEQTRLRLIESAKNAGLNIYPRGIYGATQGPRLETAAEIQRMQNDGCDMVGMTGMPEASLARELEISYACCAVVANWAAGKTSGEITMSEIEQNLEQGMKAANTLINHFLRGVN